MATMDFDFASLLNTSYSDLTGNALGNLSSSFGGSTPQLCIHPLVGNIVDVRGIAVDGRIDDSSKVILDTFNDMLQRTFAPSMAAPVGGIYYEKTLPTKDFSVLIASLARVLEIELNLSMVQWVRKCEGIEMPRYYNQVRPGGSVYASAHGTIDINGHESNRLRPLMLGDIQLLLTAYKDKFPAAIAAIVTPFRSLFKDLRKERNRASHTGLSGEDDFRKFYSGFCEMVNKGWLTSFMDLKDQLCGK